MKKIFNTYTDQVRRINKNLAFENIESRNFSDENVLIKSLSTEIDQIDGGNALSELMNAFGIIKYTPPSYGDHPDFKYLRNTVTEENHYIISMFVDIKGSTNFYRKYSSKKITLLTKTIIKAGTQITGLFGGHIYRIMGDGFFVYFGGKNQDKDTVVVKSTDASAVLSYFVQYEFFSPCGCSDTSLTNRHCP